MDALSIPISVCNKVQQDQEISFACKFDYYEENPSLIIAFPDEEALKFYKDEVFENYVDNYLKPNKTKWSYIY